jgi:hypothetical protein
VKKVGIRGVGRRELVEEERIFGSVINEIDIQGEKGREGLLEVVNDV